MAEHVKKDEFDPKTYIDAAKSYVKPGYKGPGPFMNALKKLELGVRKAEDNRKATPDTYRLFVKAANSLEEEMPEKIRGVLQKYEIFKKSCKLKEGQVYRRLPNPDTRSASHSP